MPSALASQAQTAAEDWAWARTSLAGGAQQYLGLENRRLALRYDRLGFIVQSLLQAACLFLVAGGLASEL